MNATENIKGLTSRSAAEWIPAWAGLFIAAGLAWWACPAPPHHLLTWDGLLLSTLSYVLLVLAACAVVVWIGFALVPRRTLFSSGEITVRLTAGVAWLAPLAVFGFLRSAWVLGLVVVMAATVTRAFRLFGAAESEGLFLLTPAVAGESLPNGMFQGAHSPSSFRPLLRPFLIAICLQVGVVIAIAGYKLPAATVLGLSTVLIAWSLPPPAPRSSSTKKRVSFLWLGLALALILTAVGLTPFLEGLLGDAARGGSLFRALIHEIFGGKVEQSSSPAQPAEVKDSNTTGVHKGVILWPDEPRAILLAPPPPEMPAAFVMPSQDNPWSIPFHGVYWFFKFPDTRPPEHSYKAKGSPEKMGLHSSDPYPLQMEAHQDLSSLVDLNCCRRIQVAIHNADRHPGTVSLELQLRNRRQPGKARASLGRVTVTSKPPNETDDNAEPVEEILSFDVPPTAAIRQFDEITILFRLHPGRAGASARIAIDRFVFLPRGR